MSTRIDYVFDKKVTQLAVAMDRILACKQHKLPNNRAKLLALKSVITDASAQFNAVVESVEGMDGQKELITLAHKRMTAMRKGIADAIRAKRKVREQMQAERELLLADMNAS